jgi:hypothetical protein
VRSFPWVIGALLVVLFVGGIGFWLGASAAPAAVPVAATAAAPVVYAGGWHFGFPFFGFFFFLLIMFVIFGIIRRAAWGHRGGPGWYGSAGPGGRGLNKDMPFGEETLQSWHRRAHRELPPDPPSSLTLPEDQPK